MCATHFGGRYKNSVILWTGMHLETFMFLQYSAFSEILNNLPEGDRTGKLFELFH